MLYRNLAVFAIALHNQLSLAIGFSIALLVSYFYIFINDARFPVERPEVLWIGFLASFFCFFAGVLLMKNKKRESDLTFKESVWAVVLTWILACSISALVFVLAGFPIPDRVGEFSLFRRFVDGFFESVSGFTTAGGSILASVEVFPRGILMWRSITHWLGGAGIAYLAITVWKYFKYKREKVANAEIEGPNYIEFKDEEEAREAGYDFIKIFSLLTGCLFILLIITGTYFRTVPYQNFYDVIFDAFNHSLSVMGTGGFGTYDASAGLPITENGVSVIGGLRSPASEWVIAFFMFIAGSNLSLWYILFFKGRIKDMFKNTEFRTFVAFVSLMTVGIWLVLVFDNVYSDAFVALRYAFFNVNTILSTTGLATFDFTQWPAAAEALLFCCYLVGGMVGSTAGGLKILRFMVLYKFIVIKIRNMLTGKRESSFVIDGVRYDDSAAALIVVNIVLYLLIFLAGAILIMIVSTKNIFPDGTTKTVDFTSAITASIANLGNIGPAVEIGNINAGPAGNYFAYSEMAKLIMSALMLIGRLGVFTFLMMFITPKGASKLSDQLSEQHFDSDAPILHS
jgi:trk system potassium uptake protein TrkH